MNLLYAIFFGAGATALAYNTIVKRVGYTNKGNVATMVGAIFIFSTIVFFTILDFIL